MLVVAVPLLIGAVRLAANLADEFWSFGDLAVIELSVRNALRGRQLLGPYSRFGWDHPGPALFYLLAPMYWLAGSDTRALFLSAWLVNAASLAAIVAVVRRRAGRRAAWWVAGALGVWLIGVPPSVLMSPWNPYAICLPFLLMLLLSAAAAAGSGWSLAGAAVAGSVVVQIHIGSAPVIAAVLGVAAIGLPSARLRAPAAVRSAGSRRPRPVAAAVGLVLVGTALWGPPVWEQLTRDPGNVVLTARFFRDGAPGLPNRHPLADAAGTVARHVSAIPLTMDESGALGSAGPARLAVSAGWLVAAIACMVLGRRAGQRFAVACGAVAAAAGCVTVVAATRVVDGLVPYLFVYTTTLPVAVVGGFSTLSVPARWPRPGSQVTRVIAAGLAATVALASAAVVARAPTEPEASSADVAVTSGVAGDALAQAGVRRVMVRATRHHFWPVATGLVAALERRGRLVTVDPLLVSLVGDAWTPSGLEEAEVLVGHLDDPVPPGISTPATARRLGQSGSIGVWLRDLRTTTDSGP